MLSNPLPIDEQAYQVFLFTCPGHFIFGVASHPFFVINQQGKLSRWEVLFRKNKTHPDWGHVHKDTLPFFQGIEVFPGIPIHWKTTFIGDIGASSSDSNALEMISVIENSPTSYPYKDRFLLWGPNSNTYAQWVLTQIPGINLQLPWNAFGKGYVGSLGSFQ